MQKTTRKAKKDTKQNNETDIIIEESTITEVTTQAKAKGKTSTKTTTPSKETSTQETTKTTPRTKATPTDISESEVSSKPVKDDTANLPVYQANLITNIDEIISNIESEIENIRGGTSTKGGIKFLRSVNKNVKTLRTKTIRVMKQKPAKIKKLTDRNNANSGFMKPVSISKEMSNFAGWKSDELHSRVDVTKYICNYIKDNNLQNPADKRQITPDAKLKKLLNYTPKTGEPLKYYTLQTYLKQHFPK